MDQRWTSTSMTGQIGYDGDIPMEDADLDPYNKQKYEDAGREYSAEQDTLPVNRSRPSSQYIKDEESSAARRYSPMKLSSTSQDAAPSQYASYSPNLQPNSQSPHRPTLLTSNSYSYYQSPSTLALPCSLASQVADQSSHRFTSANLPITAPPRPLESRE